MEEEERRETKQRRLWAVNSPASAARWAVAQPPAVALVRKVLALPPQLGAAWGHP